jgi:hypothetical protein
VQLGPFADQRTGRGGGGSINIDRRELGFGDVVYEGCLKSSCTGGSAPLLCRGRR